MRRVNTSYSWKLFPVVAIVVIAVLLGLFDIVPSDSGTVGSSGTNRNNMRRKGPQIKVFTARFDHAIGHKKNRDLAASDWVDLVLMNPNAQKEFVRTKQCNLNRYEQLMAANQAHFAQELWKYCALYTYGGIYIDAESPLLMSMDDILDKRHQQNFAVLSDQYVPDSIHGGILMIKDPKSPIAQSMIDLIVDTPIETLSASPLLLPRALYKLIGGKTNSNWFLYNLHCSVDPLRNLNDPDFQSHRLTHHCPLATGFCCQVIDPEHKSVVLMTKHPLLPYQQLPATEDLPKPYNPKGKAFREVDLPFITTVQEKIHPRPQDPAPTPNFFETLVKNNCLPSNQACSLCLRDKAGANCSRCKKVCSCYCKALCNTRVDEKFVSKDLTISPPLFARDPSRLVPRIVHQTWFEQVTPEKYPNMSRLIESFKQSGWEYRFYNDEDAKAFLATHFPHEVREAYDALRPGAFKADLFRYCVLLINGGVYADMDVLLEANLDRAIAPDVGFITPVDEPGKPVDKRMCLWNGFIGAAPGHPILAKVIETVVNNVRNRFTSVDVDATFCPNPELSVLHAFDTLFTAGPCILGATANRVLGRNGQAHFEPGTIESNTSAARKATSAFVRGLDDEPELRIPGRTIILKQDKWDMGAHRFTLLEQNLVVAATDMPDYDDREQLGGSDSKEHYSKTHVKVGIYGLEKLYTNNRRANENIRFFIDAKNVKRKTT